MIAAVGTAALVGAVTVLAASAVVSQWRAVRTARAVIRCTQNEWDTPVPYWPEEKTLQHSPGEALLLAALCIACRVGEGECVTCAIQCGALVCMGGFSDEDAEWLWTLSMPEGTDQ